MRTLTNKNNEKRDEVFHKEILETFFGAGGKGAEPEKKAAPEKPRKRTVAARFIRILWPVVLSLASVAFVASFIIIDMKGKRAASGASPVSDGQRGYVTILENGIFDPMTIERFAFEGDAKERSVFANNSIKLVNAERLGWARVSVHFADYADFSEGGLLIYAKGYPGKKEIAVIVRDDQGNMAKGGVSLSPQWSWKNVGFEASETIDLERIKKASIEYGAATTGNGDGSEIYIKELGIRRPAPIVTREEAP